MSLFYDEEPDAPEEHDDLDTTEAMIALRDFRAAIQPKLLEFIDRTPSIATHMGQHPMSGVNDVINQTFNVLLLRYGRSMWNESREMERQWS